MLPTASSADKLTWLRVKHYVPPSLHMTRGFGLHLFLHKSFKHIPKDPKAGLSHDMISVAKA